MPTTENMGFKDAMAAVWDGKQWRSAVQLENERLRMALTKAERILDRNLGHQTEKCYDALSIIRKALSNEQ